MSNRKPKGHFTCAHSESQMYLLAEYHDKPLEMSCLMAKAFGRSILCLRLYSGRGSCS